MKKSNKKGFTLVELLAVIAILSILLIIAIPGVLNLFNSGKRSAFVTQAQSIYKIAEENYVNDQIGGLGISKYCGIYVKNAETGKLELQDAPEGWKHLSMGGAAGISYYIEFNNDGGVDEFYISNNTDFSLGTNGDVTLNDLTIDLLNTEGLKLTTCGTPPAAS